MIGSKQSPIVYLSSNQREFLSIYKIHFEIEVFNSNYSYRYICPTRKHKLDIINESNIPKCYLIYSFCFIYMLINTWGMQASETKCNLITKSIRETLVTCTVDCIHPVFSRGILFFFSVVTSLFKRKIRATVK